MEIIVVEEKRKSVRSQAPKQAPPLGPDAVALSTRKGEKSSKEWKRTAAVILAMFCGLADETLSGDAFFLAMGRAKEYAAEYGIDEEAFNTEAGPLLDYYCESNAQNPLAGMF